MSAIPRDPSDRVATRHATHRPILVAIGPTGGAHSLRVAGACASRDASPLVVASIVIARSAFAQPVPVSVAGDWDVTVQSPQGTTSVLVTLKQDGEKLTGLFKSPLGELPLSGLPTGSRASLAPRRRNS